MRSVIILFVSTIFALSCSATRYKITPYLADSVSNTGIAVVVCPGGSYSWLDMKTEGVGVAEWLQSQGINAFVLRYHVANVTAYCFGYRVLGLGNHYPKMLTDVENALQQVYSMADSLHIDKNCIGVMGFSAGGHLTMMSFTHNRTPYKPHFLCPMYPVVTFSDSRYVHKRSRRGALGVWGQWKEQMRDSLSIERHITPDCPPVFLVNCVDDPVVKYQNSELLDSALTANGVPHKYIQYKTGGHGFGASETKGTAECRQWKKEFLQWISNLNQ
ncbi:MAG: alpha/beta hydrolase [Paludibacteraceae bacterium]|nr:alpha/beta hydrolase [Paludibacteraceae bacterium]